MLIPKGRLAFENYYRQFFATDLEFEQFITQLSTRHLPVLIFSINQADQLKNLWQTQGLTWQLLPFYQSAVYWPKEVEFGKKLPGFAESLIYPINISSLLPVLALEVNSSDKILDACSAPGGKLLALSNLLPSSSLVANDISPKRVNRLRQVAKDFHLEELRILQAPAEKLGQRLPKTFTKILVDAPCSSERHVYTSPKHLNQWSIQRVKQLQKRQLAMLQALTACLKPGGRIVYSTCAITPEENEQVVTEFLSRQPQFILNKLKLPLGGDGMPSYPVANHVTRVWPSQAEPMFVAILDHIV